MSYVDPKLSRYVGIIMDIHFPKKVWAGNLIMHMPEKGVVVTATGGAHHYIARAVEKRGDLSLKLFDTDPWTRGKKAQRARDWLLVCYLKFYNGQLFLFPNPYDHVYGKNYSDRIQDLLIMAHQSGVRYEVIAGED